MNHVLIGAAVPYLATAILYVRRGCRASTAMLLLAPLAMGLCGLWAVIPDVPRALGDLDLYYRFHQDARSDIFFLHVTIDEGYEGSMLPYTIGFVMLGASVLGAAWRELRLREGA